MREHRVTRNGIGSKARTALTAGMLAVAAMGTGAIAGTDAAETDMAGTGTPGMGTPGATMTATEIPAADVEGAGPDNVLLPRFPGSVTIGYRKSDYDRIALPLAGYANGAFRNADEPEGRVTQIAYAAPEGNALPEVYRAYEEALNTAGFQLLFQCENEGCGGAPFAAALFAPARAAMTAKDDDLMTTLLTPAEGHVRALSAELDRPEGAVEVSLMVTQNGAGPAGVLMQMVESAPMRSRQVTVDAAAMNQGLALTGHVALYGLEFDTDSAELKPGSDETLEQMAALLRTNAGLRAFVVGHTDNTGPLNHNLTLSRARAEAVVAALEDRYDIASGRLQAEGVGPFAPVASNDSEGGRQQNRRVELVRQ